MLNSVADVSPDGQYLSTIKDPDQVIIFHIIMLFRLPLFLTELEQWVMYISIYVKLLKWVTLREVDLPISIETLVTLLKMKLGSSLQYEELSRLLATCS